MIQIIGKGGIGREVASYCRDEYATYENECIGIRNDISTIIAIGDGVVRKKITEQLPDLKYTSFFAGNVWRARDCSIGDGVIICPGSILTVNVTMGIHCLVNLNCTIGHDCVIGNYVTLSPGANISGNVTIGDLCYIGTNAVIREKVNICSGVTIGAGGVVVKDITEPGVYVGNPVKKIG
jgi:sugar O-acyltransferase (sialic acid O-acetyltransferase NeuD family)